MDDRWMEYDRWMEFHFVEEANKARIATERLYALWQKANAKESEDENALWYGYWYTREHLRSTQETLARQCAPYFEVQS